MMTQGLLGNYLWRTFDASRGRPVYIIEEEGEQVSRQTKDSAEEKNAENDAKS